MGLISKAVLLGSLLRFGLLFIAEFQDYYYNLKYTDLDYSVYTDAAKYVLQGGTPYDRHTYRYTPILAYMMIPCEWYYKNFGKCLFIIFDILAGYLIEKILKTSTNLNDGTINKLTCLWFFNPIIFNVSTRGNADTIISYLVLVTVYLLLKKRYVLAAIAFGLSVHFKIYPIIYAIPMYLYIDHEKSKGIFDMKNFFTKNRIVFTLISASVFILSVAYFYYQYGWIFLYETYLYHFIRKDNRHNFSVYFYYIYLNFEGVSKIQAALAFIPQFFLVFLAGFKFYKDLPFCLFIQTFMFVIFNKVCTAQYFIWYMSLMPIVLANNDLYLKKKGKLLLIWVLWFISELLWNLGSYFLELKGENVFFEIWLSSILFFFMNTVIGYSFLSNHHLTVFEENRKQIKSEEKQSTTDQKKKN
ncbi:hypothetical protein ABPG74_008038 [Tetrahymena malaccensis]